MCVHVCKSNFTDFREAVCLGNPTYAECVTLFMLAHFTLQLQGSSKGLLFLICSVSLTWLIVSHCMAFLTARLLLVYNVTL